LEHETVGKGIHRLAALVSGLKVPAELDIDPPQFKKAGVQDVPAIWDPKSGLLWRGSVNLVSFRRALAAGQEHGVMTMGPTLPTIEPDLAEVFRQKAAAADFTGERDKAINRYWERAALIGLPQATEDTSRIVDPTTWLSSDLHDGSGHVVAAAGMPLRASGAHALQHRLVIFDATDERQVRWAREVVLEPGLPVILMVSEVDRAAGWQGWDRLVERFGMPVYVLPVQLAARLQLNAVPTLVIPGANGELVESELAEDQLPPAEGSDAGK
jgi:conjugal transfer pilus assembly protein TraW